MSDTADKHVDPKTASIGLSVPGVPSNIDVPISPLFDAYLSVHALGTERARNVMIFGAGLAQQLGKRQAPPGSLTRVLGMLEDRQAADEQGPGDIDPRELEQHVLGFCYLLLRQKVISWEQAAGIATALLDASPPISAEAWRKKTERWIVRTDRAKVGKRRPRE